MTAPRPTHHAPRPTPIPTPHSPSLTLAVILCTKDRPQELARCLASLAAQTRPADEILIVDASERTMDDAERTMDDGRWTMDDAERTMDDGRWTMDAADDGRLPSPISPLPSPISPLPSPLSPLPSLLSPLPSPLSHLSSPPGLPRQRNLGLQRTGADVIAFFDDDVELEPGYLAALLAVYERRWGQGIGGVMGSDLGWQQSSGPAHWLKRLFGLTHVRATGDRVRVSGALGVGWVARPAVEIPVEAMPGFCMSYRRGALDALHLRFDEALGGYADGEDVDVSYRLGQRCPLWQTPDARLLHHRTRTGRADLRRRFYTRTRNDRYLHRKLLPQTARNRLAWWWGAAGRLLLAAGVSLSRRTPGPLRGVLQALLAADDAPAAP